MRTSQRRRGFTLVELLVVMAIMAVLAAILLPTVAAVRRRAKNARIALEMSQIGQAVESYKLKYGDYPPDMSNYKVFERHVGKAFSRISPQEMEKVSAYLWSDWTDSGGTTRLICRIDPAEALVFWLGGLSANPKMPFTGEGGPLLEVENPGPGDPPFLGNPNRSAPLHGFKEERLTQETRTLSNGLSGIWSNDESTLLKASTDDNDPFPVYLPLGVKLPYVYSESRTYIHNRLNDVVNLPSYLPQNVNRDALRPAYPHPYFWTTELVDETGVARAYRSSFPRQVRPSDTDQVPYKWAAETTFQILSGGIDNNYGVELPLDQPKIFPNGENYSQPDLDNLANFSEGRTLEESFP